MGFGREGSRNGNKVETLGEGTVRWRRVRGGTQWDRERRGGDLIISISLLSISYQYHWDVKGGQGGVKTSRGLGGNRMVGEGEGTLTEPGRVRCDVGGEGSGDLSRDGLPVVVELLSLLLPVGMGEGERRRRDVGGGGSGDLSRDGLPVVVEVLSLFLPVLQLHFRCLTTRLSIQYDVDVDALSETEETLR